MRPSLVAAAILCAASAASAQSASPLPAERGWISISAGIAAGPKAFTDTIQTPLNQETETISTSYPAAGGAAFLGAGGFRLYKQLSAGVGVSHFSHNGDAKVDASVPHPFFDNQPRAISGTTAATHDETAVDIKVGLMLPLAPRVRLLLTGGPSVIMVRQTIVTGVKYTESYPYDTAQLAGADTTQPSESAVGFNAAADVFWLFSSHVGVGAILQASRATVKLPAHGGAVSIDAGGVFGGGGVRFVF